MNDKNKNAVNGKNLIHVYTWCIISCVPIYLLIFSSTQLYPQPRNLRECPTLHDAFMSNTHPKQSQMSKVEGNISSQTGERNATHMDSVIVL